MTSDSEGEEFFDAFDVTPGQEQSISKHLVITPKVEPDVFSQKADFLSHNKLSVPKSSNPIDPFQVPWRSHTTSPLLYPPLPSSLSSKLASSLPTLHLQESCAGNYINTQSNTQSLLLSLDITSLKEKDVMPMPPPRDLPLKLDCQIIEPTIVSKCDAEETSSTCSGSLLGTLNLVEEDDSTQKVHWRRRRVRNQDRRIKAQDDDEETSNFPPSPCESQSSSVDAVYPSNQTSAPFRVIEVDATSVYSTTFAQDKGNKPGSTGRIEAKEDIIVMESAVCSDQTELTPDSYDCAEGRRHMRIPLPPEPDVVASTKSNSLPRCEEPPISNMPISVQSLDASQINTITSVTESILLGALENDAFISSSNITSVVTVNNSSSKGTKLILVPAIPVPVAPPRKNRKRRKTNDDDTISTSSSSSLPVPPLSIVLQDADAVSNSLDIHAAVRGDYIVQSQDSERSRAPRSPEAELTQIESTGDTTSQASTPETSRTTAPRTFEPLDIPSADKPKNTGTNSSTPSTESLSSSNFSTETEARLQQAKTHPEAGRELTDEEILSQVTVLNLDTGERIPLSKAEECLPAALNPLSLHIMRLTSEYIGANVEIDQDSDDESIADMTVKKLPEFDVMSVKRKTTRIKKFFGKTMESAVNKAKTLAQEVSHRTREEKDVFEDVAPAQNVMQYVKIKTSHGHKGPVEFDNLMYVQELKGEHIGPVWCMKFSPCGRLLATAGQDHVLRVWVLKQAFNYFLDIRTKWNADVKSSPTPSQESLVSQQSSHSSEDIGTLDPNDDGLAPFMPKPFCIYSGHTADVLDLSWSKNYFMLTSSMDKTVRLWHISRKECLCIFKHVDFVTAIAFHPKDDRYFISGSLDGKLRLWSIPDKQVVMWNEVEGHPKLITAANFCQNGAFTVVGTYNGRVIFYKTAELKYYTQIHVKSSRGRNARGGRKITGIEPLQDENKLMITSNDSRIRLYNLGVLNVCCKYKGCTNVSSQIRAGFSHDGKFIVSGSENQCIYIWKTNHDYSKFSSARKDRNVYWEGVKAHSAVVTCAIFSPRPEHVFNFIEQQEAQKRERVENSGAPQSARESITTARDSTTSNKGYVLVSADFNGCIKIFLKKEKPKHSSLPASAMA